MIIMSNYVFNKIFAILVCGITNVSLVTNVTTTTYDLR